MNRAPNDRGKLHLTFENKKNIYYSLNEMLIKIFTLPILIVPVFVLTLTTTSAQTPGSLDTSLDPGTGLKLFSQANVDPAYAIAFSGDTIYIAGKFTRYDDYDTEIGRIAKLLNDGTRDATFSASADDWIKDLVRLDNGKLIIGGAFDNVNGTSSPLIARLNADGTLDESFTSLFAKNEGSVSDIEVLPDGKIILGGSFEKYDGKTRKHVLRLNSDGSLDGSFDAGSGMEGTYTNLNVVKAQPDGKILAGGNFTSFSGSSQGGIVRFNTDGSLDTSFNPGGSGALPTPPIYAGAVYDIFLQDDGKIMIAGDFTRYNDNGLAKYLVRLTENGLIDQSIKVSSAVYAVTKLSDGNILIGGSFSKVHNLDAPKIALLYPDLSLNDWLEPGSGFNADVNTLAQDKDNNIVVSGTFKNYDGTERNGLARIHYSTNTDPDFSISSNLSRITLNQGQTKSATITLKAINGFSGDVSLAVAFNGTPLADASLSFETNTVTVDGTETVDVMLNTSTSSTVKSGSFNVTATSGSIEKTVKIYYTVNAADDPTFTISADPASLSIENDSDTSTTITITPENGFSSDVALSLTNVPSGITYSFDKGTVTGGSGTSTLTLEANNEVVAGDYTINVNGSGGYYTYTNLSLTVQNTNVPNAIDRTKSLSNGVYPNPVSNSLTISSSEGLKSINLYSVEGKIVKQQNVDQNWVSMDVSKLQPGIYILQTEEADGKIETHKIIKQ
jgi:uncharacterized delta-60 repeat protein